MKDFINPWESQNPWQQGGAYHNLALEVPTSDGIVLPTKQCICQTGLTEKVFKDARTKENLNGLSDRGLTDEVSLAVNGGENKLAERREKTRILLNKFSAVSCVNM